MSRNVLELNVKYCLRVYHNNRKLMMITYLKKKLKTAIVKKDKELEEEVRQSIMILFELLKDEFSEASKDDNKN